MNELQCQIELIMYALHQCIREVSLINEIDRVFFLSLVLYELRSYVNVKC